MENIVQTSLLGAIVKQSLKEMGQEGQEKEIWKMFTEIFCQELEEERPNFQYCDIKGEYIYSREFPDNHNENYQVLSVLISKTQIKGEIEPKTYAIAQGQIISTNNYQRGDKQKELKAKVTAKSKKNKFINDDLKTEKKERKKRTVNQSKTEKL